MKRKTRYLVPRNPHVPAMRQRASGAHQKTTKALRRNARQDLMKKFREVDPSGTDAVPASFHGAVAQW